jgi:hypothetical protein
MRALPSLVRWSVVPLLLAACGGGDAAPAFDTAQSTSPSGPAAAAAPATPAAPALTRAQVVAARRKFKVRVLEFDASQQHGTEMPYADRMRLAITNGSDVTLPCLTVQTRRYAGGKMVGASRMPAIPTTDLGPGQTVEYDYYPKGHLDVVEVTRMTAVVEGMVDPDEEQFICELQAAR